MKKILQDLSYAEVQALAESMGEKKFRAKQLYEVSLSAVGFATTCISPSEETA